MNDPSAKANYYNPISILRNILRNWNLIKQFTGREITSRYRGSYLGILWSFITPVIMLTIYTLVFSGIFNAKWGTGTGSKTEFALLLFCGIVTFNIFSETITRSSGLILGNVNYVKKVVFPLEILPVVVIGSALINGLIGLSILIIGLIVLLGTFHWTIIFVPIVLLPLILLSLGLSWFFASFGVYFRDIGHVLGVAVQALMFLSPVFYPISAIPKEFQFLYYINPISYVVEDMRRILVWGQLPNMEWLAFGGILSIIIAVFGYAWFQKTRRGFADVL